MKLLVEQKHNMLAHHVASMHSISFLPYAFLDAQIDVGQADLWL